MTDADLIAKKLAFIETCLRELRVDARPRAVEVEIRERRFVGHTLQIAIQAALDVASHVVSDDRLGEPNTNRQIFEVLGRHGRLDAQLVQTLSDMAGFRNVLVHGYAEVDVRILLDVLENHLVDLDAFVAVARSGLRRAAEPTRARPYPYPVAV